MSWGIVAGAAVGLVGAGMGANATSKAADKQQEAADAAARLQQRQYDQTRADNLYRMQVGDNALTQLQGLTGDFTAPTAEEVMAEPGYQFGLKQGQDTIQNTAAAKGGLYSGNALKELTQYGGDYATTRFNDAYNRKKAGSDTQWGRLSALAGIGQTAQTQVNSAGGRYADNVGNIGQNNANVQGAAGISNANIWGNALNQAGSAYIDYTRRAPSAGGTGTMRNTDFGGSATGADFDQFYADGGPVMLEKTASGRYEPKVGTRSARPGASGGGMSRDAILAALSAVPAVPAKDGIAALPGDPLRNPAGVRALQIEATEKRLACGGAARKDMKGGGKVKGPGGPREDKIKARLSNNEHVFQAAAVKGAGGGDYERGHERLNQLRMLLEAGA